MKGEIPLNGIDVIVGSMASGKSSELLRRLIIYLESGLRVLYVNSDRDTRTDSPYSTHNPLIQTTTPIRAGDNEMCVLKVGTLGEIGDLVYDVIGIDEAQFFPDLVEFATDCADNHNIRVLVAGLDGDFMRRPFGNIAELLPHCDSIEKLTSLCRMCIQNGVRREAIFTRRTSRDMDTVVIGGVEMYQPVCRDCFMGCTDEM